ncbi:hypothetical protein L6452_00633 [Arctium lappa]|uniref:Uncharacterized protein n=1 Tax=Arctium lappa TaxID=4217 RepID=A0ACB9FFW1_ARCLA|nr:hypothetical protein L6452_00633 [Arctium lappa]
MLKHGRNRCWISKQRERNIEDEVSSPRVASMLMCVTVLQASIPKGADQIFAMSPNISDIVKEDLAWGSYTLLCNTNSISVIEGVPALIHHTEVSWDATLNPTSSFKIGQVVEAKVHQLDFSLERISLSLKEITKAYDQHPSKILKKHRAFNVILVVGDRMLVGLQQILAGDENPNLNRRFVERDYKYRPVKVVEFELSRPQCVVYLDLKRDECAKLFPSGRVYSPGIPFGRAKKKGSVYFAVDYEFAARSKPTEEYVSKYKGNYTFTGGKAVGYRNLFAIPWTSFIGEDSVYFIDGILHLRAELTIRH